ncbi:MAG: tetratricopeptide repeat protein [Acidobacteriota bacterium]|nr:tetratricopeptide repeat protein [Acidobacteriota bacterium]
MPSLLIGSSHRFLLVLAVIGLLCGSAAGQVSSGTQTVMVMPFENLSTASGLEWISEAFPEVLSQRMTSPRVYVVSRDDRTYAFDHAGIPANVHPSRATIYRIAEQMDADYVVLGSYSFDGKTFSASAQLLDMKKLHLYPAVQSSGPLTNLIDLQTLLAWELLEQMPTPPPVSREQFLKTSSPIRLDAFENYIRGITATDHSQKARYFRTALKLNPSYTQAMLQLGKTYYDNHEYELASSWFSRVPKDDPAAGDANFLLGMSEYYRGSFDKSFAAFNYLASRLPLTEVYNNLGVVEDRRGHHSSAVEYLSKAVNADPNEEDYRFNLAVALYKNGDAAGAARQLHEALQRRPNDGEAKSFLDAINRGAPSAYAQAANAAPGSESALLPSTQSRIPLERIKRNYDEASYRQLEMEIHNLAAARLSKMDRRTQATYHLERGKELLAQNMPDAAETEFRDAINVDYGNVAAHAQLANVLEKKGDLSQARSEAQLSVRLQPNVDAILVMARIFMKQNQLQAASNEVDRALALEPASSAAVTLKQEIAAKQTVSRQ